MQIVARVTGSLIGSLLNEKPLALMIWLGRFDLALVWATAQVIYHKGWEE